VGANHRLNPRYVEPFKTQKFVTDVEITRPQLISGRGAFPEGKNREMWDSLSPSKLAVLKFFKWVDCGSKNTVSKLVVIQ